MAELDETFAVRDLTVAIFRANGVIIACGDRLVADLDLTSSLWQVLDALERHGTAITIARIARNMGLRRQSVQRSADILAARNLVAYEPNPDDKRAQLVSLTRAGRQTLDAIRIRDTVAAGQVLQELSGSEVVAATRILKTYTEALARQLQTSDPR
jgi:DNA-binding MarR family transcriptional regulator